VYHKKGNKITTMQKERQCKKNENTRKVIMQKKQQHIKSNSTKKGATLVAWGTTLEE
jgi:hypothetical protein